MTLFTLTLTSCDGTKLELPNTEWCRDKGALGAHCNKQNTDEPRNIDKATWDAGRFGMFCASEEDFAANQLFLEQACLKTKGCDIEKLHNLYQKFIHRIKQLHYEPDAETKVVSR